MKNLHCLTKIGLFPGRLATSAIVALGALALMSAGAVSTAFAQADDGRNVRLSPQIRELPLGSSTPSIPRATIEKFLTGNRIIEIEAYETAPYILASVAGNLVIGAGDEVYLRGDWQDELSSYDIVRTGATYQDPESGEMLGLETVHLGSVNITMQHEDGIRLGVIRDNRMELKAGDRLLPRETEDLQPVFHPVRPDPSLSGSIIGLLAEKSVAAQYDAVVVNLGVRDGLRSGDLLTVYEANTTIKDTNAKDSVALPGMGVGEVLIYRSFDNISYGLILSSIRPVYASYAVKGQ